VRVVTICDNLPQRTLSPDDVDALRFAIRSNAEFASAIEKLPCGGLLPPDAELVGRQIREAVEFLRHAGRAGRDIRDALNADPYERSQYVNDTTAAGIDSLFVLRTLAREIVETETISLTWTAYSSLDELRSEHRAHVAVLKSPAATTEARIRALLGASRLQLVFLANTYC